MFRKFFLILGVSILTILSLTPAYASPSLSLNSNANYSLSGQLQASQNCSATPSPFSSQACSGVSPPPANVTLNGAGSVFAGALITATSQSYAATNPSVHVGYQLVGSGAGVTELAQESVDFAASDSPLSSAQIAVIPNTLTIPDTIGSVAIAYHIPINGTYSIRTGLRLNATVAAEIFQGNITYWDDPHILQLNQNSLPPGVSLPHAPITVVHRSDASQTTFALSSYLNSSTAWKLGVSKMILWPSGTLGAVGDDGLGAFITSTPYTIGYLEINFALAGSSIPGFDLGFAAISSPNGAAYVPPTVSSIGDAVSNFPASFFPPGDNATAWQHVSLIDSNNPGAYPIAYLSYIIIYRELNIYSGMTDARAFALVSFLSYLIQNGQNLSLPLGYVPLTSSLVAVDETAVKMITFNGQSPVIPPTPVTPPASMSFQVDLSGTVGWTVEGLDSARVNLLVSHQLAVSIPVGPLSISPVTESGSFEQSINLSTRIESPGTAAAIGESALASFSSALTGLTSATGTTGSQIQNMLAQTNQPIYTSWWVNGPLSTGSPVQILQGWSSVTGSESIDLGSTLGSRSAWIVTSQLSQNVNTNIPNPSNPLSASTSTVSANLNLLWSFDKSTDLLLRANHDANATAESISTVQILPPGCFIPSLTCPPTNVTVTRNMSLILHLSMRLASTNISPATPKQHSSSTLLDMLATAPWMPLGIGGIAAGVVAGLIALLSNRTRRKNVSGTNETGPPVTPPLTSP